MVGSSVVVHHTRIYRSNYDGGRDRDHFEDGIQTKLIAL